VVRHLVSIGIQKRRTQLLLRPLFVPFETADASLLD
jgi:hypothetical protein